MSAGGDSTAGAQVRWRVENLQELILLGPEDEGAGGNAPVWWKIPDPTEADRARGYVERLRALTLLVRSNTPWDLSVRLESPLEGTSLDGGPSRPALDFWVRVHGRTAYIPLREHEQSLLRGPPGEYRGDVDYRVRIDPQRYREGTDRVTIVYTLSSR